MATGLEKLKREKEGSSCLKALFHGSSSESDVSDSELAEEGKSSGNVEKDARTEVVSEITIEGASLKSVEIKLAQRRVLGIAHQLWPAAVSLCKLIADTPSVVFRDRAPENYVVLELGAGVGLVGLFMSALGCRQVFVTDLPEAQELLNANIRLNQVEDRVRAEGDSHNFCFSICAS